jgi:hypothetical protein
MPLVSSKDSFISSGGGAETLAVGPGLVYAVIASTDQATQETFTIYDSLAASGDILFQMTCNPNGPINQVWFPSSMTLKFSTGLTVDPGDCDVFVIYKS